MPGLPWWGWVGLGLIVLFFLGRFAMSQAFRALMRHEIAEFIHEIDPEIHCAFSGGQIHLAKGSEKRSFDLDPFYQIGVDAQDSVTRAGHYWQHFNQLGTADDLPWPPLSLVTHGPHVIPHFRQVASLPKKISLPHILLEETGLVVTYLLRLPRCLVPVTELRMKQLEKDVLALHELAVQNIATSVPDEALANVLERDEISAIQTVDGFGSSRLLVVQRRLKDGQQLVAMMAESSTLLLAPVPVDGNWDKLLEACRIPVGEGEPLVDVPIVVTSNSLKLHHT